HENLAAVDRAPAGDDAVGIGPLVVEAVRPVAVLREHVRFDERAGVEEELQAFARGQLAAGVLAFDGLPAAALDGLGLALGELRQSFLNGRAMVGPLRRRLRRAV